MDSEYPPVSVPRDMSLPHFLLQRFLLFKGKVALADHPSGMSLTFWDIHQGTHAVAGNLRARGLQPGDVLCMFGPNHPHWIVAFLGAMLAGAVITTANPNYTPTELLHQLKDCNARYLFTTPSLLPHAHACCWGFKAVFVLGDAAGATPFTELLAPHAGPPPHVAVNPMTDTAMLPYSSGTTSRPKGVCLTHYNIVANICQVDRPEYNDISDRDTLSLVLPLFHIYGLVVVALYGLAKGATIISFPRFEPQSYLEGLRKYRVTIAHVAPPLVQFLAKDPRVAEVDLSALRAVVSAAAPLGMELAQTLVKRLGCTLRQGYGMTEMAPISHLMPFKSQHKYNSIGRVVANMSLRIVDVESGRPVPRGQPGEFWLKGPNVMRGYLNNPEATAATIDAEGYLHTGDVGYMDEDGDCYIVDRCKELIKVKAFQVAPAELEDILQSHPAVQDCAVIGIPFEEDERPKAFVVLKAGVEPSPAVAQDIMAYVAQRVAPYKKLKELDFIEAIPKSASGKILRRQLRNPLAKL